VVGLPTQLLDAGGTVLAAHGGATSLDFTAPIATAGGGLDFTALEPADLVPMVISATDLRASSPVPGSPLDTFDVIVTTSFSAADFVGVFDANSSLDKVEIINLRLIPGFADELVVSAALSIAERKRALTIVDPPPPPMAPARSTR
jgi:hypothetical protein